MPPPTATAQQCLRAISPDAHTTLRTILQALRQEWIHAFKFLSRVAIVHWNQCKWHVALQTLLRESLVGFRLLQPLNPPYSCQWMHRMACPLLRFLQVEHLHSLPPKRHKGMRQPPPQHPKPPCPLSLLLHVLSNNLCQSSNHHTRRLLEFHLSLRLLEFHLSLPAPSIFDLHLPLSFFVLNMFRSAGQCLFDCHIHSDRSRICRQLRPVSERSALRSCRRVCERRFRVIWVHFFEYSKDCVRQFLDGNVFSNVIRPKRRVSRRRQCILRYVSKLHCSVWSRRYLPRVPSDHDSRGGAIVFAGPRQPCHNSSRSSLWLSASCQLSHDFNQFCERRCRCFGARSVAASQCALHQSVVCWSLR